MDHTVYADVEASELAQLLSGSKGMIIRGVTGRKIPHGRVQPGDVLYLTNNTMDDWLTAGEIQEVSVPAVMEGQP